MMEEWRDVKGYEGLYMVSNYGHIMAMDRMIGYRKGKLRKWNGRMKKPTITDKGYLKVTLYKNGKPETREIQRLVAETFIPNPYNKEQVNHIDGNTKNNHISNLEWTTPYENNWHRIHVLHHERARAVEQYDLSGNYIASFRSIKEAGNQTGTKPCSISNVLAGRRNKAGGYVWKYEPSERKEE